MDFTNSFSDVHKLTLHVPVGCTRNYETRSPWNNFKEIVEYAPGGNEGKEKCGTPTVGVEGNELVFRSVTEGAKYYYTIDCDDAAALTSTDDGRVELLATYKVRVYAYADGHDNSETVEAVLVWVNPSVHDADGVVAMDAKKAVVIRGGVDGLTVSGTERGERVARVALYSVDGRMLGAAAAVEGETTVPCALVKGEVYVVKYGEQAIKYRY